MSEITLPFWLFAALTLLAAWSVIAVVFLPGLRWFVRRRTERVLGEVAKRLSIRIEPFRLTKRQVLIDRLLYDPEVVEAAEARAKEDGVPRETVMARVYSYAREMVPAFNAYFYFRIGYALARGVAKALYRVRLGTSDEEGLAAIPPRSTVVFLMNHRSNMDYVLVSFLAAEKTALSYAVGEWARVWPIQQLIRATGAYFIRRRSKDALYRKVLSRYVQMATAAGVTQAVYPEGGLSRDGRLGAPRLGLIDYMLRGFDRESGRDIVFVPVGINYDRVLEDRTLLLDLDGDAPRARGTAAAMRALRFVLHNLRLVAFSRWHRFGYACVNFGTPLSLRALLADWKVELESLSREERFAHVERLGRELLGAVARVIPVLPVSLVAAVFARDPAKGYSELELKGEVLALTRRLEANGARLYVPRGDQDYAITVGLRMLTLRRMVDEENGVYRPRTGELPLLRYYANSIAHLAV